MILLVAGRNGDAQVAATLAIAFSGAGAGRILSCRLREFFLSVLFILLMLFSPFPIAWVWLCPGGVLSVL